MATVQKVLRLQTTVRAGGKVTVADPALKSGEAVEVIILFPVKDNGRRAALEILDALAGKRIFKTAEEVEAYLNEERATWDN